MVKLIEDKELNTLMSLIDASNKIVICAHVNPDGDAIGSSLALYNALKDFGKENVDVIIPEYSRCFEFLPGASEIKAEKRAASQKSILSGSIP